MGLLCWLLTQVMLISLGKLWLMVRAEITNLGVANPVTNVRCGFVDLRCEW